MCGRRVTITNYHLVGLMSLEQLANDIPGITIESMVMPISVDNKFEEPICAAENDMGRVTEAHSVTLVSELSL